MVEIKENCLYSRADLMALLAPLGVDVDHFIARLRPRKVFKMLWTGKDILAALDAAPALAEREEAREIPPASNRGNRQRRGAAAVSAPGGKLAAYRQTLKKKHS